MQTHSMARGFVHMQMGTSIRVSTSTPAWNRETAVSEEALCITRLPVHLKTAFDRSDMKSGSGSA